MKLRPESVYEVRPGQVLHPSKSTRIGEGDRFLVLSGPHPEKTLFRRFRNRRNYYCIIYNGIVQYLLDASDLDYRVAIVK